MTVPKRKKIAIAILIIIILPIATISTQDRSDVVCKLTGGERKEYKEQKAECDVCPTFEYGENTHVCEGGMFDMVHVVSLLNGL